MNLFHWVVCIVYCSFCVNYIRFMFLITTFVAFFVVVCCCLFLFIRQSKAAIGVLPSI